MHPVDWWNALVLCVIAGAIEAACLIVAVLGVIRITS